MIDFNPVALEQKAFYEQYLYDGAERGCEYSFVNVYLWGQQNLSVLHDHVVFFCKFGGHSAYRYPLGTGDKKVVLDAIIEDSKERGVPCRIGGILADEREQMEKQYPGRFIYKSNRDSHDYVYLIDDLADLKGKKLRNKRNHCYRFEDAVPNFTVQPLTEDNLSSVRQMLSDWYKDKQQPDKPDNFKMEQIAFERAFAHYRELGMDGLILLDGSNVLGFTMGSQMSPDTFDVHFEKAIADIQGTYAVINREFAKYIRNKYPEVRYFNREEDMGIEGLRKSKLSYNPHHMVEKYWATLVEDDNEN